MIHAIAMTAALALGQFGGCSNGSCGMPRGMPSGGFGGGFAPMASFSMPAAAYAPPAQAYAPPASYYAPPVARVPTATAPPPSSRRWSAPDATGKWWCNDDIGVLFSHIDQVNAKLAREPAPVLLTRYP